MKTGIIFTGSEPILVVTSFDSFTNSGLIEKSNIKGIKKFIAYEISEDIVKEKYGKHYSVIMGDLHQTNDLRVVDYNRHHVFYNFSFKNFDGPVQYEP